MLTVFLRVPTAIHSKPIGPELDMDQWHVQLSGVHSCFQRVLEQ